jgi:glutathione S-transferase
LYCSRSGNSLRAALGIELCGIDVKRIEINLNVKEQKSDWFAQINPAGVVPVLVETIGEKNFVLTQSGAILNYLIRQYRVDLIPEDPFDEALCTASVFSAVSDIAVQNALTRYLETTPEAATFVLDRMKSSLSAAFTSVTNSRYLFGEKLCIADFAHFPVVYMREAYIRNDPHFAHVVEWLDRLKMEPAVIRAISYSGLQLSYPLV